MLDNSRTIDELISLYTFENELVDFYVEGITDKLILDNYNLYKNSCTKIIEIETLDFGGVDFKELDFKSNKDKLILLSRILSANAIKSKVHCLTDKDFDGIINIPEKNKHLLQTDFCCMESYFFCRKTVQKFIEICIRDFPFQTDHIIEEIGRVLRCLFIIRFVNFKLKLNCANLKIDGNLNVKKVDGTIGFNFDDYLNKYIIANNLSKDKQKILDSVAEIIDKLDNDNRNTMNGHDFIEVLYLYINKIKSSTGFKLATFERAFLVSNQPDYFEEYPLFKLIEKI
jgi:hypothetical protein